MFPQTLRRKARRPRSSDPGAVLPAYARAQNYRSLRNPPSTGRAATATRAPITPGATLEVFNQTGAGIISHIWYTIAADSPLHLKELVMAGVLDGK